MRIVFFGTPRFAVAPLLRLIESRHEVVSVVCQPDKPAGRGHHLKLPAVKVTAQEHGIPVHQPTAVKTPEFADWLRSQGADAAVVVAYGRILPAAVLEIPRFGFFNIHASLLPKYRGAAPIQWAMVNGDTETGISIMQLDAGMDTGPVILKEPVPILEDDTAISLMGMLSVVGADAMVRVLDQVEDSGRVDAEPQDESQATYAPMLKRGDGRIDWSLPAERIILKVRGLQPWPRAYSKLQGREVKILKVEPVDAGWVETDALQNEDVPAGTVVDILRGRGFVVKCGDQHGVSVEELQFEGKPAISSSDASNGGLVKIGSRFES